MKGGEAGKLNSRCQPLTSQPPSPSLPRIWSNDDDQYEYDDYINSDTNYDDDFQ